MYNKFHIFYSEFDNKIVNFRGQKIKKTGSNIQKPSIRKIVQTIGVVSNIRKCKLKRGSCNFRGSSISRKCRSQKAYYNLFFLLR